MARGIYARRIVSVSASLLLLSAFLAGFGVAHGQADTSAFEGSDEPENATEWEGAFELAEPPQEGTSELVESSQIAFQPQAENLYVVQPDVPRCEAGTLRKDSKAGFVRALNAVRALHGLSAVGYDTASDGEVTAAALIMAANGNLSHEPPPNWKCWTAAGAHGAGSSNLLVNMASDASAYADDAGLVAQWLIEGGGDELGHRRWILDPYLGKTSLGRVTQILPDGSRIDAAVMKVFEFSTDAGPAAYVPAFVAWPQGDYPQRLFSPAARLSFTVVAGPPESYERGTVDFSQAEVTVRDGNTSLPVSAVESDNEGYGVANCLSWRVAGLRPGRRYVVTVSGISGAPKARYTYDFTIKPGSLGSAANQLPTG